MARLVTSFGTTPEAIIRGALRELPHGKYHMELTPDDMVSLLNALTNGDSNAMSLRSSILETLDIEEV